MEGADRVALPAHVRRASTSRRWRSSRSAPREGRVRRGARRAAAADERVVLLTGDLGFNALEPFAERFPDRFFNVGVAEQNMVGIATGLAEAGFVPYVYSIATFASMRPVRVHPQRPGAARAAGAHRRHGRRARLRPQRLHALRARGHRAHARAAGADDRSRRPTPTRRGARVAARGDAGAAGVLPPRARTAAPVPGLDGRFAVGRAELIGERRRRRDRRGRAASRTRPSRPPSGSEPTASTPPLPSSSSFNPAPTDDLARAAGAGAGRAHGRGALPRRRPRLARLRRSSPSAGSTAASCAAAIGQMPRGQSGSREHLLSAHGIGGPQLAASALRALSLVAG